MVKMLQARYGLNKRERGEAEDDIKRSDPEQVGFAF
jgi:hypothetical protein